MFKKKKETSPSPKLRTAHRIDLDLKRSIDRLPINKLHK